jgi:hypothetical protein
MGWEIMIRGVARRRYRHCEERSDRTPRPRGYETQRRYDESKGIVHNVDLIAGWRKNMITYQNATKFEAIK